MRQQERGRGAIENTDLLERDSRIGIAQVSRRVRCPDRRPENAAPARQRSTWRDHVGMDGSSKIHLGANRSTASRRAEEDRNRVGIESSLIRLLDVREELGKQRGKFLDLPLVRNREPPMGVVKGM